MRWFGRFDLKLDAKTVLSVGAVLGLAVATVFVYSQASRLENAERALPMDEGPLTEFEVELLFRLDRIEAALKALNGDDEQERFGPLRDFFE